MPSRVLIWWWMQSCSACASPLYYPSHGQSQGGKAIQAGHEVAQLPTPLRLCCHIRPGAQHGDNSLCFCTQSTAVKLPMNMAMRPLSRPQLQIHLRDQSLHEQ